MNIDYQALDQFRILLEYPYVIAFIVVAVIMFSLSKWIFDFEKKGPDK